MVNNHPLPPVKTYYAYLNYFSKIHDLEQSIENTLEIIHGLAVSVAD